MSERVHHPGADEQTATESAAVDRLERARDHVTDVEARIDEHGESMVEDAAEAYREASRLLETYVDRATGTGRENFKAYVELEGRFASLVENIPEDLAHHEAFESALEAIDKRRLSESDFEKARTELEPAEHFSDLIEEREDATSELAEARKNAIRRVSEIDDALEYKERLLELGSADLDAPVERLREPIRAYNDAIDEAFAAYRRDESAREVFALLERSRWYPLVPFEQPPADLREYVERNDAGTNPIPKLLEYADYSGSKLDHYVDSADELKRRVATQRTYLTGIDSEPLSVAWPPAPGNHLEYRLREIRPFAERVGGEDIVAALRAVQAVVRREEYERLQTAAVAIDQLSEDERARLAAGRVEGELESLRRERERIQEALAAGSFT